MGKPVKHRGKWRIRWTDESGTRKSEVFASYELAVVMDKRRRLHVQEVRLGLKTGVPPEKSFDDLADFWLENYAPNKRSERSDQSIIACHLRPEFGPIRLKDIGARQIDHYRVLRRKLAPQTVKNHLTLLKTMLNRAVDLGWLVSPPRFKVPRVPRDAHSFAYLRSEAEIERLLAAARKEGDGVWVFYATAIYTGLRAGEISALRREDIDLARNQITVQRSYDGPTKSGKIRRVPIFDVLRPALTEWLVRVADMPVVFPNERGGMHGPSARIFQEIFQRVLKRAKFPTVLRRGRKRPYLTFHGLRHTFASLWMSRGGDLFKLQALLGHSSITMTERYAHLAPDAFADELARFGGPANSAGVVLTLPNAGQRKTDEATNVRRLARCAGRRRRQ